MMPLVAGAAGASSLNCAHCHCAGPGQYPSAAGSKTMCGTMPLRHWPAKSESSSSRARGKSTVARPIALNAASQLH